MMDDKVLPATLNPVQMHQGRRGGHGSVAGICWQKRLSQNG